MFPELTFSPSPNWNERPLNDNGKAVIDTVVLHYTGMQSADEALDRMCDPDAEVSAHYMIGEDGETHELIPPEKRAWHAGVSIWKGRNNLNHTSVGIELVNPGHEFGYRSFPQPQIESLLNLLGHLKKGFNIPKHRFIGHSDIAPERKTDPGELFPWALLAANGYGVWSDADTSDFNVVAENGTSSPEIASINEYLGIIGYNIEKRHQRTHISKDILIAFQRHWRPQAVNGCIDRGTMVAAKAVAELMLKHQRNK